MRRITIGQPPLAITLPLAALSLVIATAGTLAQEHPQRSEEQSAAAEDSEEEQEKLQSLELADGRLVLQAPARWEKQPPRVRIIEAELSVPPKEDEQADPGRLTIMRAGGSVEANIERWYGQFVQPDGKSSKEAAKVEAKEFSDLNVHLVDLSGTYLDRRGPFAPAQKRENYRMLAAIIETDGAGNYFIKFVGPQETVKDNEKAFAQMVETLQWEK